MNWNAADDQHNGGDFFLSDDKGFECLASEAIWLEEDVDSITPPDGLTATSTLSPQLLREYLLTLAKATKELLDTNNHHGQAADAVRALINQHLR